MANGYGDLYLSPLLFSSLSIPLLAIGYVNTRTLILTHFGPGNGGTNLLRKVRTQLQDYISETQCYPEVS